MKSRKKNQMLIILFFAILILVFILYFTSPKNVNVVTINGKKIPIEIADSPEERQKGLMFRTFLPENQGMLFIFEKPSRYTFWMKNTLIPLDMIFIDENGSIKDIQTAQPCTSDPCPLYKPSELILYVLEVNADFAKKNNIKIGDEIKINVKS